MKAIIRKVFEDDHILVIDKPPQVLSLPDRHDPELFNIYHFFRQIYSDIYIVHRLDYETSGVMLLAKNAWSHKSLNQQFQNHEILKVYHALVHGIPSSNQGTINQAIQYSSKGKSHIDPLGKTSKTHYEIEEYFGYYALVKVIPDTGRTHQIRVHFKHLGHPLAGDEKYGGSAFYLSSIKKKYRSAGKEKPLLSRTALHASSIRFTHPATAKACFFETPFPKDMNATLNQLRKVLNR